MSFNNETTTEYHNFVEEHYHRNCSIILDSIKNGVQLFIRQCVCKLHLPETLFEHGLSCTFEMYKSVNGVNIHESCRCGQQKRSK